MEPYQSQNFGYRYTKQETTFKVFAKNCDAVEVTLFSDSKTYRQKAYAMANVADCIWQLTIEGDLEGQYYLYRLNRGVEQFAAQDPFAWASSANSKRSAIIDMDSSDVVGFDQDTFLPIPMQEAIIYETHIRDMTMDPSLGLKYPGKYLGVTEDVSELPYGLKHIKSLGITHLHFLPLQDFLSVDEEDPKDYNWGYDPEHFFVPEGSYATDVSQPKVRISELRQMVKACHDAGLAVVLDVVYNHTYRGGENPLAILAPLTYYRHLKDGSYANGSGCGNEIKTEEPIVQQLIIDSLCHWMKTFHIDGFRFDLMGLMDVDTAKLIVSEVYKINPHALLYGEPWTGGETPLHWEQQMLKGKQAKLPIALFNDDYRTALKGNSDGNDHGFIQGYRAKMHDIKTGIVGSIQFSEHHRGFCVEPWETINYLSAHDNLCLYDKLKYSTMWDDGKIKEATKLGLSLIFLAFGIPFIQAGSEMMRSKQMDHNSYRSSDSINAVRWSDAVKNQDLVNYVKQIIALRKYLGCFTTFNAEMIQKRVVFMRHTPIVSYRIELVGHQYACVLVMMNPMDHDFRTAIKLSDKCHVLFEGLAFEPLGIADSPLKTMRRLVLKPFQTVVIARTELPNPKTPTW